MYLLVKYEANWADEIDVSGFTVLTKEQWDQNVERIKRHFDEESELTCYIGTNEQIDYYNADEALQDFKVTEITDEQAEVLHQLFGRSWGSVKASFGFTGPDPE